VVGGTRLDEILKPLHARTELADGRAAWEFGQSRRDGDCAGAREAEFRSFSRGMW